MRLETLNSYIKTNVAPILIENIPSDVFGDSMILLPADLDMSLLNGHYEGVHFVPPTWYQELEQKDLNQPSFLVIDGLSKISQEDQMKFMEILKYRKVGVFELPKNCVVVITSEKIQGAIHPTIYSLVAHI